MQDKLSILTRRCNIRDVKLSDDGQILTAMDCPEIASMYSGGFHDISEVRDYIDVLIKEYEGGKFKTLAVAERQSDILLGCVTIDIHKHFPRAELNYWIAIPHLVSKEFSQLK